MIIKNKIETKFITMSIINFYYLVLEYHGDDDLIYI